MPRIQSDKKQSEGMTQSCSTPICPHAKSPYSHPVRIRPRESGFPQIRYQRRKDPWFLCRRQNRLLPIYLLKSRQICRRTQATQTIRCTSQRFRKNRQSSRLRSLPMSRPRVCRTRARGSSLCFRFSCARFVCFSACWAARFTSAVRTFTAAMHCLAARRCRMLCHGLSLVRSQAAPTGSPCAR